MTKRSSPISTKKSFDAALVHAGNRGLAIDHATTARSTDAVLARMSLQQKMHEIRGRQAQSIDGLYFSGGYDSLGLVALKMVDGPRGARAGKATAFPVPIARAATFDVMIERRVGMAIGREVAAKGGNVVLAPCVNLLRHPAWGRAQESYSEDSYLTGAMGVAFISGAQNYVLASPKHLAANNLEMTRFQLSANMNMRTLHEVYLPHFKRCVREAAAGSIMSAYNRVNGVYCGEHQQLLTEILRNDWGFRGFVESDWILGTRSTAPAIIAGLDIEMPAPYRYTDDKLHEAIESGDITETDIQARAKAVIYQKIAWDLNNLEAPDEDVVECQEHLRLAQEVAEKSMVLLKNLDRVLPLSDDVGKHFAVVGALAEVANLGDRGSSHVQSSSVDAPLEGLQAFVQSAELTYLATDADLQELSRFDTVIVVVGLTYLQEGEYIPTNLQQAQGDDLARGGDRSQLALPEQDVALIRAVTEMAKTTVVVLEGGSAIEVQEWIAGVDALVMAWYPGCEGGRALARVLFGEVNPSAKLPVSFSKSMDQHVAWDVNALQLEHDLFHGYRFMDKHGFEAEYPFGYGLSYTEFSVKKLQVSRVDDGFALSVQVENIGASLGASVIQLYVSCHASQVERVYKELKGFGRVELQPNEAVCLEFAVTDNELRYYDESKTRWCLEDCDYQFRVGQSSEDLPLEQSWRRDSDEWYALA